MAEIILTGDALEQLRHLPPESVHTCVTSPPYYNLRDYGAAGQIGNEASVEEYLQSLVSVFREVRRVLRADGTLWGDISIRYTGTIENAFKIAVANGLSLTDELGPGAQLIIPADAEMNSDVVNYFSAKGIQPATGLTENDLLIAQTVQRGIGYMQIGKTFKVS